MSRPMRLRSAALTLIAATAAAAPALAASWDGTYKGKATNLAGDFNYGKVLVKVKSNKVTYLEIEGVTTSGCGGYMNVVFAPNDPETQIIGGSPRIRDGRMTVKYRPVRDIEEQDTYIDARFKGNRVTGKFESLGYCENEGRFTARR